VAAVEKAEAEKLQVVMAAQGDAEAKYLQGQARAPRGAEPGLGCAAWGSVLGTAPVGATVACGPSCEPLRLRAQRFLAQVCKRSTSASHVGATSAVKCPAACPYHAHWQGQQPTRPS